MMSKLNCLYLLVAWSIIFGLAVFSLLSLLPFPYCHSFMKQENRENVKKVLQVAIRNLAEQMMRSGSLGGSFAGIGWASEDIALHRMIQQTRPAEYRAEVAITHRLDTPNFILELSGRMDGVFQTAGSIIIEEIKITDLSQAELAAGENPVHWAQLKLYAYCYAVEHAHDQITAQLTYYHLDTAKTYEFQKLFSLQELTSFFKGFISRYVEWTNTLENWRQIRDESVRALNFPFKKYRAGQREMAVAVYRAVKQKSHILVQAPTGIGKTVATLFPAIKALGEGHSDKIFFLTARNTGKNAAEEALDRLRRQGLRFKSVTLTAKEKACVRPQICCQPELCEFAQGYFDRVVQAVQEAFQYDALTPDVITQLAHKHKVCPFEYSLDLSLWADGIICDYNYAFDPRVYLKRFFQDVSENYAFLVDEAHNMVDRAREMFSAELHKQAFFDLRRAIKPYLPKLHRKMSKISTWFRLAGKTCEERGKPYAETTAPKALLPHLETFVEEAGKWLEKNTPAPYRNMMLELFFEVKWFLTVDKKYDDCYVTCFGQDGRNVRVKLFCIDPSKQMQEALQRCQSATFFSATLSPSTYFQRLFGCKPDSRALAFPSPFSPAHLCLLIMPTISTRYKDRPATVSDVTQAVLELVQSRQGNYLLFFPSYQYMQMVYQAFLSCGLDGDAIIQTQAMTEESRTAFLSQFNHDNTRTLVGFAVMGGIFGEGIDLVGDRLTGAAVVGVGLPAISLERELIREYFDRVDQAGYEFAYLFPGLIRVLQAAGRVIRTETDRGAVLLIDERFAATRYRSLFPKEWRPVRVTSQSQMRKELHRFWESREESLH
jgi:DNA excision repair protein ERCC-2